ncbi:MAG: serine/threonine protein kinase [Verrucomicrobia bacterium]|nr:serine/threonine protein kinase [Verrucomicrobiota bacterium]MBU4366806.1 serine/threonine protein kinase [Verrucomicrobiota bacterium]
MLITFSCPECKAELEVAATDGGSQVLCPQCSKTLTVPRKGPGPGVTIGQFQIQKLLGKGGMGEVYLARQLSLGRDIALKILPARLRGQKTRVQRFFKEVQILARLDHPNIVMAHEAGEDEDILYLAMGYVPGDSLEKCLQHDGPMAELDALKLIDKLAGALDYAWREHHLLHRDIKPSNILLTSGGEIKLTDFGLAKCLDDATELTMSGDIIGSPNYMSPEQINNCADLDCRSDMYSLGTTLYHLLTGKLPFAGSSLMETLKKQINEFLPDPRIERSEISEACIILLEIMLAKNRNDRHADYQTLRADIARVIAGERPTKGALQPGESVLLRLIVERTPHRPKTPPVGSKPPTTKTHGLGVKWAVGAMLGLAVTLGLVVVLARGSCRTQKPALLTATPPYVAPVTSAPVAPRAVSLSPAVDEAQTKLKERCLDALKYAREHPDDFTGIQDLLASLVKESEGTEWEGKIADAIGRIERARKHAVYKAVTSLKADVQAQVAQSNFEGALKRIELDPGLVTEETTAVRTELAQEVKARKQALEEAQAMQAAAAAKAKLAALAQGLAGDLLKGDTTALTQRLKEAQADADLNMVTNEVNEIGSLAQQAAGWPEQVAKSFEENRRKSVTVEFKDGRTELFLVTGIAGEKISGQRQVSAGYVGRDFWINDLSAGEKLKRLGDNSQAAVKLMRGLVMVRYANDWAAAEKEFAAGGPLGEALIRQSPVRQAPTRAMQAGAATAKPQAKPAEAAGTADAKSEGVASVESKKPTSTKAMDRKPMGPKERQARQALLNLLKLADVSDDLSNVQAVAATIRRKEFPHHTVAKINEALSDFNKNYAQTETAQENIPIIKALVHAAHLLQPAQRPFKQRWQRMWRTFY